MQKSVRYNAVAAIIPASLLSVVFLISALHYNVAQAKSRTATAVACGKELQKQCSGVPVRQIKCSSAFKRLRFPQDVTHWRTMLCACVIETQCSVAKASLEDTATFLDV
jgi:hypothetical protein